MNAEMYNKIETMIEYLIKADAQPEYITEMVEKLYKAEKLDYTPEELQEKVYSSLEMFKKGTHEGRLTLQAEVLDFILSSGNGSITLNDCYSSLNIKEKKDKASCRMAIQRICQKGIIEAVGNKSGVYRKLNKQAEKIDFLAATGQPLDLKWTFGIEKLCMILPKNIVVVTGSPDTGKTAFLLDFIRRNMARFKINYFSSEMGSLELQSRLKKFPIRLESWNFNPVERSSNFADVIKPNEINVIDFLEIHQDFFLVGQMIKDIYDKLENGIAVIAIQKNTGKGNDMARGGVGSLEKPRLYISLSNNPHTLKIVKAKNWVNDMINPNGKFMRYKIIGGCQFKREKNAQGEECDWEKEEIEAEDTKTTVRRRF